MLITTGSLLNTDDMEPEPAVVERKVCTNKISEKYHLVGFGH